MFGLTILPSCDVETLLSGEQSSEDELSADALAAASAIDPATSRLLAETANPDGRVYIARDATDQVCLVVDVSTAVVGCSTAPATNLTVGHPTYTAMLTDGVGTEDLAADGWDVLTDGGCLAVRS